METISKQEALVQLELLLPTVQTEGQAMSYGLVREFIQLLKEKTTQIYTVGYDSEYIKQTNSGWGCGYILIPIEHPFLIAMREKEKLEFDADPENYSFWGYQIPEFSQEITLQKNVEINNTKYCKMGFDTSHIWNNKYNSNYDRVLEWTLEMQSIVESYT